MSDKKVTWILDCWRCYKFFYDEDNSRFICDECEEEE